MEHAEKTDTFKKGKATLQDYKSILKAIDEMNLAELFDENACRKAILQSIHPQGPHCPGCGKPIQSQKGLQNFWEFRRVFCKHCEKIFTAATSTMIAGLQMDFRTLYVMSVLLSFKVDKKRIAAALKIHPDTVRLWEAKFRAEENRQLEPCQGESNL